MKTALENFLCRRPRLYACLEARRMQPDEEKRVYLALMRAGQTVVEAGANLGHYTRLFCRITGPRGRVLAFEPVNATHDALAAGCATAELPRAPELFRLGLSDSPQTLTIYTPGSDHGQSSLRQHVGGDWGGEGDVVAQEIQVVALDDLLREQNAAPDFIKLDVEGAELLALRGAEKTLEQHQPIMHVEISDHWLASFDHSPEMVCHYLTAHGGYDTWWAYGPDIGLPHAIEGIASVPQPRSLNLIALCSAKHSTAIATLEKIYG